MKHDHLPALNKYTSPNQYAALQEIDKTNSLVSLITQGRMGTTLGALIRSAWVDSEVIKNAEGVTSERWFVTDAGKHAMQLYEIKLEQEKQKEASRLEALRLIKEAEEKEKEVEQEVYKTLTAYYDLKLTYKDTLRAEWAKVTEAISKTKLPTYKFDKIHREVKIRAGFETPRYVSDCLKDEARPPARGVWRGGKFYEYVKGPDW
jgi:hypothetical protein